MATGAFTEQDGSSDMGLEGQLRLEEYRAVRGEIDTTLAEHRKLQSLVVTGCAIFYAWSVNEGIFGALWALPPLLVLLSGLRSLAWARRIADLAGYLREVETHLSFLGWETYFQQVVLKGQHSRGSRVSPIDLVFWILLLAGTLAAPCFLAPNGNVCRLCA